MQEITVFDLNGNSIINLVQWDKDVKIFVQEDEIDKAYNVHFFNQNHQDTAMVVESAYQDTILSAVIPNDLLTEPYPITGYIYVEKNNEHKSVYGFRILVRKRPKPANYIYSDQKEYITFEKVLEEAKDFANTAQEIADKVKQSEENAKASEENAKISEKTAVLKADEAELSAEKALQSETNAKNSEENSLESANNSEEFALQSKSFAKGTGGKVRPNDDSDCAEYYYEQIKQISQGIKGIIPMGSITFAELSDPNNQSEGFMFDISDEFISDERFKNGSGIFYGAGSNVIFTADGKWDVLASSNVSGVKGDNESYFRQGFVNITPDNIGSVASDSGDISNTIISFEEPENMENIESGENAKTILGKIRKIFSNIKNIAFTGDFKDLINVPNGKVTIKQGEDIKGSFSMNQTDDTIIKLPDINALWDSMFDKFLEANLETNHPIGSFYISVNDVNPSELFGGEWERIGAGRTLVTVDSTNANFNAPKKTGGSATSILLNHNHGNAHTHSFSGSQAHNHGPSIANRYFCYIPATYGNAWLGAASNTGKVVGYSTTNEWGRSTVTGNATVTISGTTGGASANTGYSGSEEGGISNYAPYFTTYMWYRTA